MDLRAQDDLKPGRFAVLRTPRLVLRPPSEADADAVADGIGNYDVARWLGKVPYPYAPEDARAFVRKATADVGRCWFIHAGAGAVGGLRVGSELGYWIARPFWGRGYATEAAIAAIDAHFAQTEAETLESGHFAGNERSARVLARLGFAATGRRKVASRVLGQDVEGLVLHLSRTTWDARRAALRQAFGWDRPAQEGTGS